MGEGNNNTYTLVKKLGQLRNLLPPYRYLCCLETSVYVLDMYTMYENSKLSSIHWFFNHYHSLLVIVVMKTNAVQHWPGNSIIMT